MDADRIAIVNEWLASLPPVERQIALMWAAGHTQAEIGAHPAVRLSQPTVGRRIAAWQKKHISGD